MKINFEADLANISKTQMVVTSVATTLSLVCVVINPPSGMTGIGPLAAYMIAIAMLVNMLCYLSFTVWKEQPLLSFPAMVPIGWLLAHTIHPFSTGILVVGATLAAIVTFMVMRKRKDQTFGKA